MSTFNCELCTKSFTLKHNLSKHIKIYHNDNISADVKLKKPKFELKIEASNHTSELALAKNLEENNNNEDNESVISSHSSNSNSVKNIPVNVRVVELQYQLKIKDLEMAKMNHEYEMKLQMKDKEIELKDTEIRNLKNEYQLKLENMKQSIELMITKELLNKMQQNSVHYAQPIQQPIQANIVTTTDELIPKPTQQNLIINCGASLVSPVEQVSCHAEPIKQIKSKPTTKESLDNLMKNGFTIEECCEKYLNDEEYNKYITLYEFENEYGTFEKNILHKNFILNSNYSNVSKNCHDIIFSFFKKFDKKTLPFLCTDNNKSRKTIYLKTKGGIIKHCISKQDNDNDKFNKIVYTLICKTLQSVINALSNTYDIFKNNKTSFSENYKKVKNFEDWIHSKHKSSIAGNLMLIDDNIKYLKENVIEDVKNIMMGLKCKSHLKSKKEDEDENEDENEDEYVAEGTEDEYVAEGTEDEYEDEDEDE